MKREEVMNLVRKYKKRMFIAALGALLLILILLLIFREALGSAFVGLSALLLFSILAVLFVGANFVMRKEMYKQRNPFDIFSGIRNVDNMYIGEITDSFDGGRVQSKGLRVLIPGATEASVYEVLRHTFSILDESGSTVVLCVNGSKHEQYNIFSIPFFNEVTINRLHLQGLKAKFRFPLVFDFFGCLRFEFKIGRKAYESECENEEILKFCRERNISLKYLVAK